MEHLQPSLAILSKSVHYRNLTAASLHIGLSQPQISRHIAKIEEELQLPLLDRSSKRKSVWTPAAYDLALLYERSQRKLQHSLQELQLKNQPTHLHIGTLEGLSDLARQFSELILKNTSVNFLQLDVFDQNEIEAQFNSQNIDVAFTSRVPNKQKLKHIYELGHQEFLKFNSNKDFEVYSVFEFNQKKKATKNVKTIVSNSLMIRRNWLETLGGKGQIPGEVKKMRSKSQTSVLIIGTELLSETVWQQTKLLFDD